MNDVPKELNEFYKKFTEYSYKYSANSLFSDFIEYGIAYFSCGAIEIENIKSRYNDNVLHILFVDMVNIYKQGIEANGWYDGLGEFYEAIASKYKRSDFGQFFTPRSIVDFNVQIILGDDAEIGSKILDPAVVS